MSQTTNQNLALLRREWLQHRFTWLVLVLVPLALAVLVLGFATVEVTVGDVPDGLSSSLSSGPSSSLNMAALTIAITTVLMYLLGVCGGLMFALGLARRDHADRSVEFWLSMPVGHARSLAVPVLVHLVLFPLVLAAVGAAMGVLLSAILVARNASLGAWFALPWADLLGAMAVVLARLAAGWPLALLWLSPLLVLAMLAAAWLRRWGLVGLGFLLLLAPTALGQFLGLGWLGAAVKNACVGALTALVNGQPQAQAWLARKLPLPEQAQSVLAWALTDLAGALRDLASVQFVGGLAVAGLLFVALLHWRKQGAHALG